MISARIISLFLVNLLLLILVAPRATSSSVHDQAKAIAVHRTTIDSDEVLPVRYRVFYIKNTTSFLLDVLRRREAARSGRRFKRSESLKRRKLKKMAALSTRRKKIKKTENARPNFSVMLPKGFVPPSGSSPCHNGNPNSVVFFCANAKP